MVFYSLFWGLLQYLEEVSTRKVQDITEKLCGLEVSSTQVSRLTQELDESFTLFRNRAITEMCYLYSDATQLKIRHKGTVIDRAILLAYGITPEGKRDIVGSLLQLVSSRGPLERIFPTPALSRHEWSKINHQ